MIDSKLDCSDYRPEHDRLKKQRDEAVFQERQRQMSRVESDFLHQGGDEPLDPLLSTRRRLQPQRDIFLQNPAVAGESSDEDDDDLRQRIEQDGEPTPNKLERVSRYSRIRSYHPRIYHPVAYIGHFRPEPNFYLDISSSPPVISATLRDARPLCFLRARWLQRNGQV